MKKKKKQKPAPTPLKAALAALGLHITTEFDAQKRWNEKTLREMESGFQRVLGIYDAAQSRIAELRSISLRSDQVRRIEQNLVTVDGRVDYISQRLWRLEQLLRNKKKPLIKKPMRGKK